jgi:hypothetical protein
MGVGALLRELTVTRIDCPSMGMELMIDGRVRHLGKEDERCRGERGPMYVWESYERVFCRPCKQLSYYSVLFLFFPFLCYLSFSDFFFLSCIYFTHYDEACCPSLFPLTYQNIHSSYAYILQFFFSRHHYHSRTRFVHFHLTLFGDIIECEYDTN